MSSNVFRSSVVMGALVLLNLWTLPAFAGPSTASTPEPGSAALFFGSGVVGAGLLLYRRLRKK